MRSGLRWCESSRALVGFILLAASNLNAQTIRLHVDLVDAPRNIYHAHLQIPAHAGEMRLVFPKWIPGNHRPSGPIGALTGIHMLGAGHELAWQRLTASLKRCPDTNLEFFQQTVKPRPICFHLRMG